MKPNLGPLTRWSRPRLSLQQQREQLYERQKYRLSAFAQARPNFDTARLSEYNAAAGWHVDDYAQDLMPEGPGAPWPDGSFEATKQVLQNYSFPPPDLITGLFTPDTPLAERVMVLRGRFLVFTFWFGVRISSVVDEVRDLPNGGREAVWGYSYQTLEGHYEMGQIDFTVHKELATGRVTVRIHAVSRTGYIPNLIYRIGFRVFGRYLQRRFAFGSLERIKSQVGEMLREHTLTPPPSETPVQPIEAEDLPQQVAEQVDQETGSNLTEQAATQQTPQKDTSKTDNSV